MSIGSTNMGHRGTICGKVRATTQATGSTFTFLPQGRSIIPAGYGSINVTGSALWGASSVSPSSEIVFTPSLTDLCYGTGTCAPKECPICTFMVRPGDDHDCAHLANSVGRSGTISRHGLAAQFLVVLEQAWQRAEALEREYNLSKDDKGQPNAEWLTACVQAVHHATDEAASVIMD